MIDLELSFRRMLLPSGIFVAVLAAHYGWVGLYPEECAPAGPSASFDACGAEPCGCAAGSAGLSWFQRYLDSQSYCLGLSYAMALAFAASAFGQCRQGRGCAARNLAIGSATLSGFLGVTGCYLLGCCGSPMLPIYLNLLGAAFVPFAKPLVAGLTALSLLVAWAWMMGRSVPSRVPAVPSGNHGQCECGQIALTRTEPECATVPTSKLHLPKPELDALPPNSV